MSVQFFSEIQRGLGLSGTGIDLFVSTPVLCFGLLAPLSLPLAHKLGPERAVGLALVVLTLGLAVREGPNTFTLFVGTVLMAAGIAIANVLVPAVIKRDVLAPSGLLMGLYTCGMNGFAAIAAGTTVPLGRLIGHGCAARSHPGVCSASLG